ncbi:diacylglycerol kinase (ATP) [Rhizobium sp. NFR07]|uniref:diacylglycerol kinase n=1 Tax=Rhizobium sp. NFR07 TaxID=1566262 RepID=UPI0008DEF23A|nr:diacylglycerol kinase [Rhizobium sp. NFR07]SFB54067.1 diacylglycerol kinase (ATP) [Rhizobium sp. NFR07]
MTFPDCAAVGQVIGPVAFEADGPPPIPPISKVTGSRHLLAALGYSLGGAGRLLRETAFRHELMACVAILIAFAVVGAEFGEYVMMAILLLGLAATEALNTAIEEIIDRISPEWSSTGMHAKNLGSFAVFCMLAASGLMAAYVIFSRLLLS